MSKTSGAAGKVSTHFETVPLEVVREIAMEDLPADQTFGAAMDSVERPARKKLPTPVPTRAPAGKQR